jgi:DNA gyrase/topoisomerase IV subunit B
VENEATRQLMAAGLECVSREYFGIYTLRGKLPNVRENKHALEHHDFVAITKALGLSPTTQSVQDLRYGSVLIVADQDA